MTFSGFVRTWLSFALSLAVAVGAILISYLFPGAWHREGGVTILKVVAMLAVVWSSASFLTILTIVTLRRQGRPESEAMMIGRIYRLISIIFMVLIIAYGFDQLGKFGAAFSMFGGMLLGWSLQAPVSGFAAWLLVSVKRPFRPGDRIQFPSLGLTGDVQDIGPMYVVLDQVGGTVGSEEAVGRYILVPNAMLFSQVVINFTVKQEAAFMLDEVVARITYDSNMQKAERILLDAARKITGDIIAKTKHEPYIRSDLYDYGIYLRLRYQTQVQDRARIAYEINKEIVKAIQETPEVDLAIPFIYSYRSGLADMDRKEESGEGKGAEEVRKIPVARIRVPAEALDPRDVEQLSRSIAVSGLLQPIMVQALPDEDGFEILAGHLRLAACKSLGWKTVPAIVRGTSSSPDAPTRPLGLESIRKE